MFAKIKIALIMIVFVFIAHFVLKIENIYILVKIFMFELSKKFKN